MKSVIYETTGRAREYNDLAINLFDGCGHRCLYCWSPVATHKDPGIFFGDPKPRVTPAEVEKSVHLWVRKQEMMGRPWPYEHRPVLLCFTCDPYQPVEAETKLTRSTIEILHAHGLRVTILTKGGYRARRDFDMLRPGDEFAVTLTCTPLNTVGSEQWEPGAASPIQRLTTLMEAHQLGIRTWVSLEPVIYPDSVPLLVKMTRGYVDFYKLGRLNYHEHSKTIDWKAFGWKMKEYMDRLGVKYMFKKDLIDDMGLKDAGGSAAPVQI